MGLLVDGVWLDQWYDTKSTGGRFVRQGFHVQELGHAGWRARGRPEREGSRRSAAGIISTSRSPAPGRTGR